jgi:NAD dependent epimerase/dehydratase family enzyme
VLDGQRVVPHKALALGYRFRHSSLDGALAALVGEKGAAEAVP